MTPRLIGGGPESGSVVACSAGRRRLVLGERGLAAEQRRPSGHAFHDSRCHGHPPVVAHRPPRRLAKTAYRRTRHCRPIPTPVSRPAYCRRPAQQNAESEAPPSSVHRAHITPLGRADQHPGARPRSPGRDLLGATAELLAALRRSGVQPSSRHRPSVNLMRIRQTSSRPSPLCTIVDDGAHVRSTSRIGHALREPGAAHVIRARARGNRPHMPVSAPRQREPKNNDQLRARLFIFSPIHCHNHRSAADTLQPFPCPVSGQSHTGIGILGTMKRGPARRGLINTFISIRQRAGDQSPGFRSHNPRRRRQDARLLHQFD